MSLDFFLTEPYLKLTINKPDDVVAFAALAACGLIAAAFGRRRERWSELAGRAGAELDVVKTLVEQLRAGAALDDILESLRTGFGLEAIALRDEGERILAAAGADLMPAAPPQTRLDPKTLVPADQSRLRFGARGLRLPAGGGRLRVPGDGGFAFLDLWEGDARGFGGYETLALSIAVSVLGLELARRRAGATGAA
jgi:hypothetical protein